MQQHQRFYELAQKWLNGTISEEEKKEFDEWYEQDGGQPLHVPTEFAASEEALRRRMLHAIVKRRKAAVFSIKPYGILKVAAVILVVVCSAAFYYYLSRQKASSTAQPDAVAKQETAKQPAILPGGNKAVLVLGNGSTVVLDTTANGTIAQEPNAQVVKLSDGQLAYATVKSERAAISYNTLATPRGGQYKITLADGTKVWLNAASTLRFPAAFNGPERIVELKGEGYFEVAKDAAHPFKVKVADVEVSVLGTQFNVMAYDEEEAVKATLLEGAVRVSKKEAQVLLQPGQQAQVSDKSKIRVQHHVNTEEVIAWKNGYFNFEGSSIDAIMRQLSRWYDVEVVYKDKINTRFYGAISRNVGIDKVFKMLELTGAVRFKVEGNKVVVQSEKAMQ